jgi:hypothetical protein
VLGVNLMRGLVFESRVKTLSSVAEFDVPGNICPGVLPGRINSAVNPLDFHGGVERLGKGVVETHSSGPDRSPDAEKLSRRREGCAGILSSAVGVKPISV